MGKYADSILEIINESYEHMTAEQVFFEVKKMYPGIVLATVYNNLNTLYSKGLIRRLSIEGSPERYDRIQRHDHLVCRKCGRLADFNFTDLTKNLESQLGEGVLSYDLKVFYLCPDCRDASMETHDINDGKKN